MASIVRGEVTIGSWPNMPAIQGSITDLHIDETIFKVQIDIVEKY
jgi:hypothetical protein